MKKLVVVGNGMAGVGCVEQILKHAPAFDITILGEETHVNYNRILLSSVLAGEKDADEITLNPPEWYWRNKVNLRVGARVCHRVADRCGHRHHHHVACQPHDFCGRLGHTGDDPLLRRALFRTNHARPRGRRFRPRTHHATEFVESRRRLRAARGAVLSRREQRYHGGRGDQRKQSRHRRHPRERSTLNSRCHGDRNRPLTRPIRAATVRERY